MNYLTLACFHLATVIPAFLLGAFLLLSRKGSGRHKQLGKVYLALMLITAITSLLMPAKVGPVFLNHFGYIHLLSGLTIYAVPTALVAIRQGNTAKHKRIMVVLYTGGILLAGAFAFIPGRLLHGWLFNV
ncbi:MAG: DUF2306 domain-containing protein [Marinobacterium sp.]|nr:DUF2306 domain-containing protein [Marinobacterium sp.]